jgi:hypothetical protein
MTTRRLKVNSGSPTTTNVGWYFHCFKNISIVLCAILMIFSIRMYCHLLKFNDGTTIFSSDQIVPSLPTSKSISELSWDKAMKKAEKELLGFDYDYNSKSYIDKYGVANMPSCLVPDTKGLDKLMKKLLIDADDDRRRQEEQTDNTNKSNNRLLPLPILNMGMPKTGSTTLQHFFLCIGLKTTHQNPNEAICMRDATTIGLPPVKTCAPTMEAAMQMDEDKPLGYIHGKRDKETPKDECFFPQLSLLEEFHQENSEATFIVNFRPVHDWIRSIKGWNTLLLRLSQCNLPNLRFDVPSHFDVDQYNKGNTTAQVVVDQIMVQFFCSHVIHLRDFVNQNPSHALIELELYDSNKTQHVLETIFPPPLYETTQQPKVCYKQANVSLKKKTVP